MGTVFRRRFSYRGGVHDEKNCWDVAQPLSEDKGAPEGTAGQRSRDRPAEFMSVQS